MNFDARVLVTGVGTCALIWFVERVLRKLAATTTIVDVFMRLSLRTCTQTMAEVRGGKLRLAVARCVDELQPPRESVKERNICPFLKTSQRNVRDSSCNLVD